MLKPSSAASYSNGDLRFDIEKRTVARPTLSDAATAFRRVRWFRTHYDPHDRIVNAWLDARLQEDFLEARTLKYVVVMEALCSLVGELHPEILTKFVDTKEWRSIGKQVLPDLQQRLRHLMGDRAVGVFSHSTWGNINRVGFSISLHESLKKLGIEMDPARIAQFKDVRNKIIHSLKYLTPNDFEGLPWGPENDHWQHFIAVAVFVDEVILRLFGLAPRVENPYVE